MWWLLAALWAQAAPRDDADRLLRAGQFEQALSSVDSALAAAPGDAQLRFQKGVILTQLQRRTEAIAIYAGLTEDFPDLAEPYNNLAVLYAAEGRLDKAREALETALRNDPAYGTAQENLGDVYVRLAMRAYEASGDHSALMQRKLELARRLLRTPDPTGTPIPPPADP
jgi:Flp pilus assembly protein TadD